VAAQSRIEIEIHTPTSCILTLSGEHDLASREALSMALTLARTYSNVLVDLTSCTFLDTSVSHAVLDAAAQLRQAHRSLELIVPPSAAGIRRALSLAGLLPVFPLHATRTAALAAVASAELIRGHQRRLDLRNLSARIDHLTNVVTASRAPRVSKAHEGVTKLRAQVSEIDTAETAARQRGTHEEKPL
jgi:anti-anti-sigma factor